MYHYLSVLTGILLLLASCNMGPDYDALLAKTWKVENITLDKTPDEAALKSLNRLARNESVFQFRKDKSFAIKLGDDYISGTWEVDTKASPLHSLQLLNEGGNLSKMDISSIDDNKLVLVSDFQYDTFSSTMQQTLIPTEDMVITIPDHKKKVGLCDKLPKYNQFFEPPHNIPSYFDYSEAMNCSESSQRPILVVFTSSQSEYCKHIAQKVLPHKTVRFVQKAFVFVCLYTDNNDSVEFNQNEVSLLEADNSLLLESFGIDYGIAATDLPTYAVVDLEGKIVKYFYYDEQKTTDDFHHFLVQSLNSI